MRKLWAVSEKFVQINSFSITLGEFTEALAYLPYLLQLASLRFLFRSFPTLCTSQAIDIKKKQRLQTLLLAMVVIFAVSSLPIDLFNVLQDMEIVYKVETVSKTLRQSIFFFSHWLAMAGALLNPLVYAWWNTNFRRQIQDIINGHRRNSLKRRPHSAVDSVCKNQQRCDERVVGMLRDRRECDNDAQV
ncbi:unnamed protein product [Angiostrongylus costaricensis]|uniref:G_PROTEIN_RECEP_F1_2 domain-containing protein n=1 Tax=Angiostrongylus costaricensis TaxID=334426 RepID=A0A0R3PLH0_ANGCS|nr:unnamed protein product [Angiostrongylus costaricensis]